MTQSPAFARLLQLAPQSQRKQAEPRGAAAEVGAVLAVECLSELARLPRIAVRLAPTRSASARALPDHDRAVGPEAVTMSDDPAGQHSPDAIGAATGKLL